MVDPILALTQFCGSHSLCYLFLHACRSFNLFLWVFLYMHSTLPFPKKYKMQL